MKVRYSVGGVRYGGRRRSGMVVGGGQVRWSEAVRYGGRRRSGAVIG